MEKAEAIRPYLNRRTLILGEVKAGKTARTLEILHAFIRAGYADRIAVIDMAPEMIGGVGGKLSLPADMPVLYLTTAIAAPRLTGVDEADIHRLARQNALAVETLFAELRRQPKEILFVNDASLYLQAGDPDMFLSILATASTQIVNTYFGGTFKDSALTRREKRLTEALMKTCDRIIALNPSAVES